jgi:hypothetical protein
MVAAKVPDTVTDMDTGTGMGMVMEKNMVMVMTYLVAIVRGQQCEVYRTSQYLTCCNVYTLTTATAASTFLWTAWLRKQNALSSQLGVGRVLSEDAVGKTGINIRQTGQFIFVPFLPLFEQKELLCVDIFHI